jgi:hypothetical protein
MVSLKRIEVPTHSDDRGDLSVVEISDFVEWTPKRFYYVTNIKGNRGAHAVLGERKIYVCMKGFVRAKFHDGDKWHEFELKGPRDAILMDGFCWRDFTDFSSDAVLAAISNMNYEPDKYIYNFEDFLKTSK